MRTLPRYVVDGHESADEDSPFMGDGQFPPFVVFDVAQQENLPGEYPTRADAQRIAAVKNVEEIRAYLNEVMDAENDVVNSSPYRSPEYRTSAWRSNALYNALRALDGFETEG